MAWWNPLTWRAAPENFEDVIRRLDSAARGESSTGIVLSAKRALELSTSLACVKAIADGCATPALNVFEEGADGRGRLARENPVFRVLNRRPNEFQTSFEFRRTMTAHAVLTGNALAIISRVRGEVRELWPVVPGSFHIERRGRYDLRFRCYDEFGLIGEFGPHEVLHLPNFQWDGIKGMDAVRLASAALGLSVAAEEHQATLHKNGGRPAGILSTDQKVSLDTVTRLRESWRKFTTSNRNGTAILDQGFKYEALAGKPVDNQHLETRRFQVEEICRGFGVFPIMVGHSDKAATFASAEAFFGAHRIHTLSPWWELWRQRLDEFVLDGSGPLYAEFDTRYMQGGSIKDRAVFARTMAEMGIYTRNELRDDEGRDPLPGLDEPLTPLNMAKTGRNSENETEAGDDPQA